MKTYKVLVNGALLGEEPDTLVPIATTAQGLFQICIAYLYDMGDIEPVEA